MILIVLRQLYVHYIAGPDKWGNYVSIATEGKRQSPIDIEPKNSKFDPKLLEPALKYSYTPNKATVLLNTGLSAQVKYDSEGSSKFIRSIRADTLHSAKFNKILQKLPVHVFWMS